MVLSGEYNENVFDMKMLKHWKYLLTDSLVSYHLNHLKRITLLDIICKYGESKLILKRNFQQD